MAVRFVPLLLLLISGGLSWAQEFPELTGRVVDQARLLSSTTEAELTERLVAWEAQSSDQIVVVTLQSLGDVPIRDYGYQLGRHWGIGVGDGTDGRELNNGVLLVVAPNDRQVAIEVGYGLEGTLTDAQSKLIIERGIVPAFRAGQFDEGVVRGIDGILAVLQGTEEEWMQRRERAGGRPVAEGEGGFPFGLIILLAIVILPRLLRRRSGLIFDSDVYRRRRGAGTADALAWMMASQMTRSPRGGGFSSGGFGGGGFSGGGGSFGGGGASGSW
ncbi:MAG: TPM domain-containing protein [Parvularculaceae bacterium]|nr:TPM domain-containing protein [Parvularculaceae bacterium]